MIQDIALFTVIFASGMLVGYLLKVVLMNKEIDKITRGVITVTPFICSYSPSVRENRRNYGN